MIPKWPAASLNYFQFKPNGEFLVGDARYEIQKLPQRYDLIIQDCFTGGAEPIHLLSVEMLMSLKNKLNQSGLLVLNYAGFIEGKGAEAVSSVYKTLKQVMPYIKVFATENQVFTDLVLVAAMQELPLDNRIPQIQWLREHEIQLPETPGFIITDDYNPMESKPVPKAEKYREIFMQRVAPELLVL